MALLLPLHFTLNGVQEHGRARGAPAASCADSCPHRLGSQEAAGRSSAFASVLLREKQRSILHLCRPGITRRLVLRQSIEKENPCHVCFSPKREQRRLSGSPTSRPGACIFLHIALLPPVPCVPPFPKSCALSSFPQTPAIPATALVGAPAEPDAVRRPTTIQSLVAESHPASPVPVTSHNRQAPSGVTAAVHLSSLHPPSALQSRKQEGTPSSVLPALEPTPPPAHDSTAPRPPPAIACRPTARGTSRRRRTTSRPPWTLP